MLRRKRKPLKKNCQNNRTVFLPDNSLVRQFSVRIARKAYTAHSRRKENHAFCQQHAFEAPTVLVSSLTLKASAAYLQRGLKLDLGAQDRNARAWNHRRTAQGGEGGEGGCIPPPSPKFWAT